MIGTSNNWYFGNLSCFSEYQLWPVLITSGICAFRINWKKVMESFRGEVKKRGRLAILLGNVWKCFLTGKTPEGNIPFNNCSSKNAWSEYSPNGKNAWSVAYREYFLVLRRTVKIFPSGVFPVRRHFQTFPVFDGKSPNEKVPLLISP